MINVQIDVPKALMPFVSPKDEREKLVRNAMIIFPFIRDETISYGRAAEILAIKKIELIQLYGSLGLPYFDQTKEELEDDLQNIKSVVGRSL
jgi:predicted HTH domain antitoxin